MKAKAYAKINLDLRVGEVYENGLHEIMSIVAPISLHDKIMIRLTNQASNKIISKTPWFKTSALNDFLLDFQTEFSLSKKVLIKIKKNIPLGAGLGGISTVLATLLNCLSSLYKLDLTLMQKADFIEKYGQDCVYFLKPLPGVMLKTGSTVEYLGKCPFKYVHLKNFSEPFETARMYQKVKPYEIDTEKVKELIKLFNEGKTDEFWASVQNDFDKVYELTNPDEQAINLALKKACYKLQTTGSGSSVYTLDGNFEDKQIKYPAISYFKRYKFLNYQNIQFSKQSTFKKILYFLQKLIFVWNSSHFQRIGNGVFL